MKRARYLEGYRARCSCWSGQRDSNPRVSAWEADALPLGDARLSLTSSLTPAIKFSILRAPHKDKMSFPSSRLQAGIQRESRPKRTRLPYAFKAFGRLLWSSTLLDEISVA